MGYTCPLCGQPVSFAKYRDITGIWEERKKALAKINEKRTKLIKRFQEKEKRLKQRTSQLKRQSARLIRETVSKRTAPLEAQLSALRRREREIEQSTHAKIQKTKILAHQHAERQWNRRLKSLKKKFEASVRNRVSKEKKQTAFRLERKYVRLRNSFQNSVRQIHAKDVRLRRQTEQIHRFERSSRAMIQKATAQASRSAEKRWTRKVGLLRKELNASMRDRIRDEREHTAERIEKRYEHMRNSFFNTLQQMQAKEKQLRAQNKQIKELRRQLQRETTPQIEGLLYEETLLKELQKRFPHDKFKHTGKSGDILHWPMKENHVAGLIVYECKRVQRYLPAHVKQAAEAKEKVKADFVVLVTSAMKTKTRGFFAEKGVLIIHPAGVLSFINILREQIIRIAEMKLGQLQRNKAVKLTLEYLEGSEFTNAMDGIMTQAMELYEELKHEVKDHVAVWRKRTASYEKVYEDASTVKNTTRALLSGEADYKDLIHTESLPSILELPELEKAVSSHSGTHAAVRKESITESEH